MPSVINIAVLVESMAPSRMLKKGGWGSWDDPRARATRSLRRMEMKRPGALLARRTRTMKGWNDTRAGPLLPERARSECARSTAAVGPTRVPYHESFNVPKYFFHSLLAARHPIGRYRGNSGSISAKDL